MVWGSGHAVGRTALLVSVTIAMSDMATAHPHVFINGGVDVIFDAQGRIEALSVTWVYDAFESLYQVTSLGLSPRPDGTLSDEDTAAMTAVLSVFPEDFDGSAHLTVSGQPIEMAWPSDVVVEMEDGLLRQSFRRRLETPVSVAAENVEIGFYERTYFFDFSITEPPELHNGPAGCDVAVLPFEPDAASDALRAVLARLARDEDPEIVNAGAQLADRIQISCPD